MIPYEIIKKKRDGGAITAEEMNFLVSGTLNGKIPEYVLSAFLMAVFFRGMTPEETAQLTRVYIESGIRMKFDFPTSDKHSTGGVGDKISLMLAPIAACCGVSVPMLSGRGLGHTGGTLDKMESIHGLSTALSMEAFRNQVEQIGCAIAAQTKDLCPADGRIYSLRDVTGTVESIPLITASIMSKKIAEGTGSLVLDVKVGSGAFMKSPDKARELSQSLINVGELSGVKTSALLTDMSEPLGHFIGNALEVREAIEFLRGENIESRLYDVTVALLCRMLVVSGIFDDSDSACKKIEGVLASGEALAKFAKMIEMQGGNPRVVDDLSLLPVAKFHTPVKAKKAGFISAIDTEGVGMAGVAMGAGRAVKESIIDPAVGFEVVRNLGDKVAEGDEILIIQHNAADISHIVAQLEAAYSIGQENPATSPLIHGLMDKNGFREL